MNEINLHLDRPAARDLYDALQMLGEHLAAGAPIPYPPQPVSDHLRSVMKQLEEQLGLLGTAEAMTHDRGA
jgi:hypothetical protein